LRQKVTRQVSWLSGDHYFVSLPKFLQWHNAINKNSAQNNSLITVAGAALALLFKSIKQRTTFPFILHFD